MNNAVNSPDIGFEKLLAKVDYLSSQQDILDCFVRFSRGIDRSDRAILLSAFHGDAVIVSGDFVGGPRDLFDWASTAHEAAQHATHHNLLNHSCDIDGDVAHAETYYLFVGRNRDDSNFAAGGRYISRLERRGGQWKIFQCDVIAEWAGMIPTMAIPFADVPDVHGNGAPSRNTEDPSYMRPLMNYRKAHIPE